MMTHSLDLEATPSESCELSLRPTTPWRSTSLILIATLISLLGWKLYLTFGPLLILAKASDPLQYMGPAVFGQMSYDTLSFGPRSMACSGWPWLDRITLAIGLRLSILFSWAPEYAAPIYCTFMELLTLLGASFWLTRNTNMLGAIIFLICYICSPGITPYSTSTGPENALVAFSLLAFVSMYYDDAKDGSYPLLSGIFAAFTVFSKVTGVFIPITLLILAWSSTNRVWIISRFLVGCFLGVGILAISFSGLFGYEQLFTTIQQFFLENIETNLKGRVNYNNFVNYMEVFSRQDFLPGLLGLFLCTRYAYLKRHSRLFWYTLSMLFTLYLVYYASERGYRPKLRYAYPILVFTSLYVSKYLGEILHSSRSLARVSGLIFALSILPFFFLGNYLANTYSPIGVFSPSMIDEEFSRWVGALYGCGTILILVCLAALQFSFKNQSRIASFAALLLVLWTPAHPGGVSNYYMEYEHNALQEYYERAKLPLLVPNRHLDIYMSDWQNQKRIVRIAWAYHFFFDPLYRNNSYASIPEKRKRKVRFLSNATWLSSYAAPFVLTDSPKPVLGALPKHYRIVRRIKWKDRVLYVIRTKNREDRSRVNAT